MFDSSDASNSSDDAQGDLSELVTRYEALKQDREDFFFDPEELEDVIEFYLYTDEHGKAAEAIERALSLFPYENGFVLKKARLLLEKGRISHALRLLDKARVTEPSNFEIFLVAARAHDLAGRRAEALANLRQAEAYAGPDELHAVYMGFAAVYQNFGPAKQAIPYFHKVLALEANMPGVLNDLALTYRDSGTCIEGVAWFGQYLTGDNSFSSEGWECLGHLHAQMGQWDQALAAYEFALVLDEEDARHHYNKGHALQNLERYPEALDILMQAQQMQPENMDVTCGIGACYQRMGNYDEAKKFFGLAVAHQPYLAEAYYGLGECSEHENDHAKAKHWFDKALNIDDSVADYWYSLGDACYNLHKMEEAEQAYAKVIELEPDYLDARLDLAFLLNEGGGRAEAIKMLRDGLSLHPQDADLHYRLAGYLLEHGTANEGLLYLQKALQIDPAKANLLAEYSPATLAIATVTDLLDRYKNG